MVFVEIGSSIALVFFDDFLRNPQSWLVNGMVYHWFYDISDNGAIHVCKFIFPFSHSDTYDSLFNIAME